MTSNKIALIGLVFVLILSLSSAPDLTPPGSSAEDLNLLSGSRPPEKLKDIIIPAKDWHPYPRSAERAEWQKLPERIRLAHIRRAEEHLGAEWETPKASVFLEYVRTGNRTNYQRIANLRRSRLADLVLGECFEGRGRFLDDIMNGVWTIAEETYWGVPAHVSVQKSGPGLPDVSEPTVDLFAAETAMLLAWTDYLVGPELDRISPLVRERLRYEIDRRIISVNLERDDFWWMGFSGRPVNNWNPWICSNWLTCVLLVEPDEGRRIQSVHKILRCLDQFLNPYPRDGGCDEGPGYWSRAGASLYDCLELLKSASGGKIDIFETPLIKEMGRYIHRVHIAGPYFINFADAAAKANPDPGVVYRYGKAIGDDTMMGFGSFLAAQKKLGEGYVPGQFGTLGRTLPTLFCLEELLSAPAKEPLIRDFWLPELQVMGARSMAGSSRGFYVAAKGGHNAESHNHNDIGNFIVYHDGLPALIDVGVETYTAKTFSDCRYEIWTMQSAYHNLPTINGVMQKDGREFKAHDVSYKSDGKSVHFGLDIAGAYPEEAGVKSWLRTVTMRRGKDVVIRDRYVLKEAREDLQLSLMSWRIPVLETEGKIRLDILEEGSPSKPLYIHYDRAKFRVEIEPLPLEDAQLRSSWGERLYRIFLTARKTPLSGNFSIRLAE
ncbi:MAG: heparinase II/III family protein [Candidatus Aminicenantales bacterium]